MLTPIRKRTLTRGRYAYHRLQTRQHCSERMSRSSLQHPLVQAAASNDVDLLRKLLRQGTDPNEEMSGDDHAHVLHI